MIDFDLDLDLDLDEGLLEAGQNDTYFEIIPITLEHKNDNDEIVETTVYITDDIDVALYFNKDLDEFSSYDYYLLPEGLEIRNEKLLNIMKRGDKVSKTPTEITESRLLEFNNLFIRSNLLFVHRK